MTEFASHSKMDCAVCALPASPTRENNTKRIERIISVRLCNNKCRLAMRERFLPCLNHELVINKFCAFHLCSLMCCTFAPKVALTFTVVAKHTCCFHRKTTNKKLNDKIFIRENDIRILKIDAFNRLWPEK